ncbi:Formin-binding protein 1 [Irineochytrium annulatum]|nr:Formin-binding protein 1 [Irineochytrium annulatum]
MGRRSTRGVTVSVAQISLLTVPLVFEKDQWREVETYSADGVHFMMTLNDFMKKRAEIESEYAKGLQRLVKPLKDELTKKMGEQKGSTYNKATIGSSVMQAWKQLLSQTENEALSTLTVAEKMNTELRKTVKNQAKENEKKNKERFDEVKKALADLQKQVITMDKLREKFEAEQKATEEARGKHEKAAKSNRPDKEVDALKADIEKKGLIASNTMETYQQSIGEFKSELQREDEDNRVKPIKAALNSYYELLVSQQPSMTGSLTSMNNVFQAIDGESDTALFITTMKTGSDLPPDYQFDEKVARDLTAKKPAGAKLATLKLSDEKDDDDIFNLPPKKARKAAADKLKLLEKDSFDYEKKRQGIDTLISVYDQKATKDPKYLQDLVSQRSATDIRIDNLGLKRHRLNCFIAQLDGTTAPEMPASLVGKTIQSPASAAPSSPERYATSPQKSSTLASPAAGAAQAESDRNSADASGEWSGRAGAGSSDSCRVKMLYDFEAAPGSQEVSAYTGEILNIMEKQDDGRNGEVKEGYIPG